MIQTRKVYITGFMGCGKTTAGKKLASLLDWQFLDLDELLEKQYKKSIEEIFMLSGEKTFREYESAILHNLNIEVDTIISVGGGAPCFGDNLEYMKSTGKIIYLKMTPSQLKTRLLEDKKPRPLLKGLNEQDLEKFIELRLAERELFYMQAVLIEDGSDLDIKILAEKVKQLFRSRGK
jgi:shikimate kinase